jgi:hypothetical protein
MKVTVEVIDETSIQERSGSGSEFSLRPNPTSGQFKVDFEQVRNGRIEVMDLTGRQVHEADVNGSRANMDLSGQEEGVYFIRLIDQDGGTLGVKRLVLSH